MATYKVHKTQNYTVMSNYHLRDKELSFKAKGLLSVMLSLPAEWDYSINGLVAICKENNTAVESALKELKKYGYLIVTKKMPNETESGRIEYEYDIYESPQEALVLSAEKQGIEKQGVENSPQLNTKKSITKELNTNELNIDDMGNKRKRFVPPSVEEVKQYCIERKNNVDPERFVDYYTANGWQVGKNKMKDWKASVRTWERNSFDSKAGKTYGATGVEIKKPAEDDLAGIF